MNQVYAKLQHELQDTMLTVIKHVKLTIMQTAENKEKDVHQVQTASQDNASDVQMLKTAKHG